MNDILKKVLPFKVGVVPYFKGSLEFSMVENKLFLQGGAAVDSEGSSLFLPKNVYEILQDINLTYFENHTKYYFYIQQNMFQNEEIDESIYKHTQLEEGVTFFIATHKYEGAVLLGEVDIDYEVGNAEGKSSISIATNAFAPKKNEIDIRFIERLNTVVAPMNQEESRAIGETLFTFASLLQYKMKKEQKFELATLCAAFFTLSDSVMTTSLSHHALYQKLENHSKLFAWVDKEVWGEKVSVFIDKIEEMFEHNTQQYKSTFYHLDKEREDGFFYQVLDNIEKMCDALMQTEEKINVEISPDVDLEQIHRSSILEDFSLDPLPDDSFQAPQEVVEDDEEEHATILLGMGEQKYIQIGRGTQSGNDIIMGEEDKTVSRIHVRITAHKQGFFIEDLSTMGTYVDGHKIEKNKKKFVTSKNNIVLGKKNCVLDLAHLKIQSLLGK
ncbi:MAG TPA: FHA domain-containing protein [Sulfurospirillum arcachonense]|nr:FHA domain-containing protein [Sulfurovum sp.]HIP44624.1 FHA domain-containing protein [Sulfurospirillum arcachonense]